MDQFGNSSRQISASRWGVMVEQAKANRRSFDYGSCDTTARTFAQDDKFEVDLRIGI
jgi:hypothetical protein